MKISQLNQTDFITEMKFPALKDGTNYAIKGSDLRDIFVITDNSTQTYTARLAVPIVEHNWGGSTRYIGIRIDHLLNPLMHLDFTLTVHMKLHDRACSAYVCLLRNNTAEVKVQTSQHDNNGTATDDITFKGFYSEDDKTWLVLELYDADAIMHVSVAELCCHYFGTSPHTGTALRKFSNYQVKLFTADNGALPQTEVQL